MGYERLSAQDTTFLHIESATQPMHVGALAVFEGERFFDDRGRFRLDDVRDVIASRLHLVPRFRKRLLMVPLEQGRPVWVDDEDFDLSYHVRLTALPRPGTEAQLLALMGRLQSQVLDRRRPLWELWFVEGLEGGRVALIQKTHHSLVDGVSGVDVATVLLDLEPDPAPVEAPEWEPEPAPTPVRLAAESIAERLFVPAEMARSMRAALRGPQAVARRVASVGRAMLEVGRVAPRAPWNVPISAHRRFEPARVPLDLVKSIKDAAGVTVNDVVLAACAGGLRSFLEEREEPVDGLVLRALVPVSVRADDERMTLGNRVSAMVADLPVGEPDAATRLRIVSDHIAGQKEVDVAVGGDTILRLTDFAPPNLLGVMSRLVVRTRPVNLGITNVPGPDQPLYCMGARLGEAFPYVGIIDNQALMIGVISYDGQLGFGLTGDREVLPDLATLARGIEDAFTELAGAVGVTVARR